MNPFLVGTTKRERFNTGNPEDKYEVDMMFSSGLTFNYTQTEILGGVKVAELPYAGKMKFM